MDIVLSCRGQNFPARRWQFWEFLLILLVGVALGLHGCGPSGDSGNSSAPTVPSPSLEQEVVHNLLELYSQALLQEDIDRLDELLQPEEGLAQESTATATTALAFRQARSADFQTGIILAHQILPDTIRFAAEPQRVTFLEVESIAAPATEDAATWAQHTSLFRTTFTLAQEQEAAVRTVRIRTAHREAPLVQVTTWGQIQAGALTRVTVAGTEAPFPLTSVAVEVPETGIIQTLEASAVGFQGLFTPPLQPQPQPLRVHLEGANGETLVLRHHYRLRSQGEGVVQPLAGTQASRLLAVTVGPDGTVWAGADENALLYKVPPGATTALVEGRLRENTAGRVEDLTFDALGRLHAVFFAPGAGGVIAADADVFCQTVNVFDPAYPFRFQELPDGAQSPSPSTRAAAAGNGDIWLFGSDGGVSRVEDTFRNGLCPEGHVAVRYAPVWQRGNSGLPTNTVPALVAARDGTLWFGTILGLTRLRHGQFTLLPFDPAVSLPEKVATLEAFFRQVAQALFAARPLSTIAIGDVSFLEEFGRPLVKEDLIFSAVEDLQGRLWIGTLGGGLRRLEGDTQTLHLTHLDGLPSNLILALAVAPDGAIWAATDAGVSRLQEADGRRTITTFTALDGLALPVRDVTVDPAGIPWLATDGGLFRILPQGGQLQGVVRDPDGRPVAGVDVLVQGTPFRAVTDAEGRFVLANVPPGTHHLQFDGQLAAAGPFTAAVHDVTLGTGIQTVEPVTLAPVEGLQLVQVSGSGQTGIVGRPLPLPLVVAVLGKSGEPVPDLQVTFTITAGNGSLSPLQPVLTDAQGQAAAELTVGTQAGANDVMVTVPGLTPLRFTATGQPDRSKARLIRVSGNNQSGQPGEVLPAPLVVRLEDQFGNPIVGEPITAELLRGEGELQPVSQASLGGQTALLRQTGESATATTNEQGEVAFTLLVQSEEDVVVQVSAPELEEVRPVQFLAIVGTVDTPDRPRDVAVSGTTVYIADRFSGLQVIDVSTPENPRRLDPIDFDGSEERLAIASNRVYVAADFPHRLYILDITMPLTPVLLGSADLPEAVEQHGINGVEVQGDFAYVLTDDRITTSGTIQVVDIRDPANARVIGTSAPLPDRPQDIAVAGAFAYVPADAAGLLVFDISNPTAPTLHTVLEGTFLTGITVAGAFAYVVETRAGVNHFTILDLQTPASPQRRGAVQTRSVRQIDTRFPIAVAGGFAYLVEFTFGIQAIDISNPDTPGLVGRIDTPSEALNVAATDMFIYVTDLIFGLQVIRGPGAAPVDTDGDGVADFFDAFPTNPAESQDTDRDGLGDATDADDDNDSFPDMEDLDPTDPRIFPAGLPPVGTTTLTVDAASTALARERNGTPEAPYRSITEALRAIRALPEGHVPPDTPLTVEVRAGTYSPLTTQEIFPLDLFRLSSLIIRGAGRESTVIDAAFQGDVLSLINTARVTIEGFSLLHGATGLLINRTTGLTLRGNRIAENALEGIAMGINSDARNMITANTIDGNGLFGLHLFENAAAAVTNNSFRNNTRDGIFVVGASTAEIIANTIISNGDEGIQIQDVSEATIMANDIQANKETGIFIVNQSRAQITLNNTIGNELDGIAVQNASHATITNNTITHSARDGIFVVGASTAVITANTVSGNGDGIQIERSSQATISHNTIRDNAEDGIFVVSTSMAEIAANTVSGNGLAGIRIQDASAATIGLDGDVLTLAHNGDAGIRITADGSVAQINSARIVFDGNAGGTIVGSVLDFSDADLDGLSDTEEASLGTNPNTPDTDGDTFSDGVEVTSDADPLAPGSTPTILLYGAVHADPAGLSTFYVLDPTTGSATRVGAVGFQRVSGLDVHADGTVYATGVSLATGRHVLLTIDPVTGAGTEIGPTGVEALALQTVTDLALRNADNALYAYFGPGDPVGTLDPASGTATTLGASGVSCCGNGIAFSPEDMLFHANDQALHTLDQRSGTATAVAPLDFPPPADTRPRIKAMDFQPDTGLLFAVLEDGAAGAFKTYLTLIDTTTGEVTLIGPTAPGLDALAWHTGSTDFP